MVLIQIFRLILALMQQNFHNVTKKFRAYKFIWDFLTADLEWLVLELHNFVKFILSKFERHKSEPEIFSKILFNISHLFFLKNTNMPHKFFKSILINDIFFKIFWAMFLDQNFNWIAQTIFSHLFGFFVRLKLRI